MQLRLFAASSLLTGRKDKIGAGSCKAGVSLPLYLPAPPRVSGDEDGRLAGKTGHACGRAVSELDGCDAHVDPGRGFDQARGNQQGRVIVLSPGARAREKADVVALRLRRYALSVPASE